MDKIQKELLFTIADIDETPKGAHNIRENGKKVSRNVTENIDIVSKEDKDGIDIIVKANTKNENVHIPVIVTEGISDLVYNDFYIGENADVNIIAGCGINNQTCSTARHDGIHTFHLAKGAKLKYVEKHYATGEGSGDNILNPVTIINQDEDSIMEMETVQIGGVTSTVRKTTCNLGENTTLRISERVMTTGSQFAKTEFEVELNGKNSSVHVASRSVAKDNSIQEFISNIDGNTKCFGHVECDGILMDSGRVIATPKITANNVDANLVHEAAIGKIAGEQLIKLMSLGLSEKEAEDRIISGFLK